MLQALWLALNVALGVPVALVLLLVAREALRALLALTLGFRVFEIQLGVGPRRFAAPLGPIDLAMASIPLGGATLAASGRPRHHRIGRVALAGAPVLAQLAGLVVQQTLDPAWASALLNGPAPLAALGLANGLLLLLHALLPIEAMLQVPTDIRALLDAGFGRPASSRQARAEYYVRLARQRLERGDVEAARQSLAQGLVQLGRERLLVEGEAALEDGDLESVVDQGVCADALRRLVESPDPHGQEEPTSATRERIRWGLIRCLPLVVACLGLVYAEREPIARAWHGQRLTHGDAVVAAGDPQACAEALAGWRRPGAWIEHAAGGDPAIHRDAASQRARLERCRGDLAAALAHQLEAVEAAVEARHDRAARPEASRWLASELSLAEALVGAGELEHARGGFQRALAAFSRAERQLAQVEPDVARWPHSVERAHALTAIAQTRSSLGSARDEVLAGLGRVASTR